MVKKNNARACEIINVHASIMSSSTKKKAGNYFYWENGALLLANINRL